jgi:hypothetical protein
MFQPLDHPLVRRNVVAHQCQDHHHHMLGDTEAVGVGHFRDRDAPVHRRLQIRMIGADAGGNDDF